MQKEACSPAKGIVAQGNNSEFRMAMRNAVYEMQNAERLMANA